MEKIVLNGLCIASHINNIIESSCSSQCNKDFFVKSSSWGIKHCDDSFPSVLLAYSLDMILSPSKINFIIGAVYFRILNRLLAYLNTNNLDIRQSVFNRNSYSSNSWTEVQDNIAITHCFNDLLIQDFTHGDIDLQKSWRWNSEQVIKYFLLIETRSIQNLWFFSWNAVWLSVVW